MAQVFLKTFAERNSKTIKGFTPQAMQKLVRYSWPGNVRELMNAVERAVVLSRTEMVGEDELIFTMADQVASYDERAGNPNRLLLDKQNLSLEEMEKQRILEVLETCEGNKSEAARRLGITRKTLRLKLDKYEKNR